MNWLKRKLRAWLGIDQMQINTAFRLDEQTYKIAALERQLEEFKTALKAKANQVVRMVPRVLDYESAQVEALKEFKEN